MDHEVDENDYSCEEDIEHIYNRPDMILSSDDHILRNMDVYNFETGLVTSVETDIPPAVIQLTVEAIANAADHVKRSRLKGFPERAEGLPSIEIDMDPRKISIKNYGLAVPVTPHEVYKIPTPQFLFGSLRSSSNYKGERTGIGRNGYGIKAVNIFSTLFELTIVNAPRKVSYYQTWTNKMGTQTNPVIQSTTEKESSVTITYTLDFERFKMIEYPPAYFGIIAHLLQSLSCSSKIITRFNDLIFDCRHILDYAKSIHPPEALENAIVHYELDDPKTQQIEIVNDRPTPISNCGKVVVPRIEALIIDSSLTNSRIYSFANGMPTEDGGVHVDALLNQIVPRIVKYVNTTQDETVSKKKKEKVPAPTNSKGPKIKRSDVIPGLAILLFVHITNPKFDSQIKSRLRSPTPTISIPTSVTDKLFEWDFVNRLKAVLKGLEIHSLTKTDGSKTGFVKLKKGVDANEAGKRRWRDCTLIVTEGDSALTYAIAWLSKFQNGSDFYGAIPFRGKFINCRKASPKKILENSEIELLKKVLGLKEGQKTIEGLRYGRLMIMADADDDGNHIKSLISNFFDQFYPELLASGFIIDYRTKYLLARKRGAERFFYTLNEFEEWKKITPKWKSWDYGYYKGLGTNNKEDIAKDAQNPKMVDFIVDDKAREMFQMLFGKEEASKRKEWYMRVKEIESPYILGSSVSYTEFFDRELSNFVTTSLHRAIPKMSDGLKHSQRQVIWGTMKTFTPASKDTWIKNKIKVAQLSNSVARCVAYHHNEVALNGVIINLAKDFMGANNMPLLVPDGQFGSRIKPNDNASPRYIYTYPTEWFYLLFRPEDTPILDLLIDDGKEVEPVTFHPIVPICLLNGAEGMATGWSTSILSYHPLDIVNYVLWWLKGGRRVTKKLPELVPSYVGFKGETKLVKDAPFDPEAVLFMGEEMDTSSNEENDQKEEGPAEEETLFENVDTTKVLLEDSPPSKCDRVEFTGTFETNHNEGTVTVTELPPGRWFQKYYLNLQDLKEKKKISSFKHYFSEEEANFVIKGMDRPTHEKLNLVKKVSITNIVLLNEKDVPVRYNTIQEYLHDFCIQRLTIYKKRRTYYLRHLSERIKTLEEKIKFLEFVVDGTIVVYKRKKVDIKKDMEEHNIDPSIYDSTLLSEMDEEKLTKSKTTLESLLKEKDEYEKLSPTDLWEKELNELAAQINKDPRLNRTYGIEVQYAK